MRFAALTAALLAPAAADMPLTLFSDAEVEQYGARCLDGSPSGYYFEAGAQADKWVIFLEGGGACVSEVDCKVRTMGDLGSSAAWPEIHEAGAEWQDLNNLISTNATLNPDFFDWNHVFVPYGSGDCHTGTQTEANDWGLYFAGHNTLAAVLDKLDVAASAAEVILTGDSAGGIGTWNNVDFVAHKLADAAVVGVPQGGWFFPLVSTFDDWQSNVTNPVGTNNQTMELWDSYIGDNACAAAVPDAATCGSIDGAYQYIETPMFMLQDAFDSNQLYSQLGVPEDGSQAEEDYVRYFGDAMMQSIGQVANKEGDGLFLASCLDHVDNLNLASPTRVAGHSFGEILHNWYFKTGGPTHIADDIEEDSLPSNPTCDNLPSSSSSRGVRWGQMFV